jgi:hypothetical protein
MEVDMNTLGQDMALALRIRRAREVVEPLFNILVSNETVVLTRIADAVDKALTLGESVIAADGSLSWVLKPALDIRKAPAATGVATKAENARKEEAIRADEQSKLASATASTATAAPAQTGATGDASPADSTSQKTTFVTPKKR